MPSPDALVAGTAPPRRHPLPLVAWLRAHWPVIGGLLLLAIPTFATLAEQSWSTEAGAHGPIVLATGLWLLLQARGEIMANPRPLAWPWIIVLMAPLIVAYAYGRALDLMVIESLALYGFAMLAVARFAGIRAIWRNFFPFLYLAFLIPPPGWALDLFTGPLREGISSTATWLLHSAGYPVAREGVVIYIAQYQLLVEDACSGMNSLIGLTAISLFYIYILHRASWRHAGLLLAAIIPIAIIANLIRVLLLILLTYYAGDAVAQGFLHNTAGIMLFAIALALVVATDYGLRQVLRKPAAAVPA